MIGMTIIRNHIVYVGSILGKLSEVVSKHRKVKIIGSNNNYIKTFQLIKL